VSTGVSIAQDSLHHPAHKFAIINHAIHCLRHLLLTDDVINTESQIIQHIADKNGLNVDVRLMIRRRRLRLLLADPAAPSAPSTDRIRRIRLLFLGTHPSKMARELSKLNYPVGFYPLTSVRGLINLKDPIPLEKRSDIYRLTCGDCPVQYIGQTGRSLFKRLGDHRTAFRNRQPSDSAMAKHCLDYHHNFSKVQHRLIRSCSEGRLMNKAEEVETIAAHTLSNQNLLNDMDAVYVTPITRYYYDYNPPPSS